MIAGSPSHRRARCTVALAACLALVAARARAESVFTLADRSTIVVRGVVDGVERYDHDRLLVFTITPRTVLKGTLEKGAPVKLVQERVFGSERPYFAPGTETLAFAVPLPPYSYYRRALPAGSYLQWTDHKETGSSLTALDDAAAADAVAGYLAASRDDASTLGRYLATVLASPIARLRVDAIAEIARRRDVAVTLDEAALAPVKTLLAGDRAPTDERAAILLALARAGAPGAAVLADSALTTAGPLQAAAVDALVALGRVPALDRLLRWSHGEDPALRAAAVRGLARVPARAALDRVAEVVRADPAPGVRLAAVNALGDARDARAVPVLATAIGGDERALTVAASEALARIGTPDAIRALGEALRSGNFAAENAAAFALGQSGTAEAMAILHEQRDAHPDSRVRKVIKLVLGEKVEEHDE